MTAEIIVKVTRDKSLSERRSTGRQLPHNLNQAEEGRRTYTADMKTFLEEFAWKHLQWTYAHPQVFFLPQWQNDTTIDLFYLVYRTLYWCYFWMVTYFYIRISWNSPVWIKLNAFYYYTFWVYTACSLWATLSLVTVTAKYIQQINSEEINDVEHRRWYQIQLLINSASMDSALAMAIGYWTLVYLYQRVAYGVGASLLHLWTPLLALADFMITSMPVKLLHVYPSLILAVAYGVFSFCHYLSGSKSIFGEPYLYQILDYRKPLTAISGLVAILVYIVLGRFVVYWLYRLRKTKCVSAKKQVEGSPGLNSS
ncbi:protein rolling stone-like [Cylas formicarius]|uniref:protein rolling stone-like n=1 Tax=Cylas formicarius TaxID=197179 RepID=UPI002958ACB7|nr:protein rolling stone-like [Cylas formicarius]